MVAMAAGLRDALLSLVYAAVEGLSNPLPSRLLPHLAKPALIIFLVPAGVVAGVLVALGSQTRLGMWPQLAMPNFGKVFSFNGIKRLFNKDTLIDLFIAAVKVVLVVHGLPPDPMGGTELHALALARALRRRDLDVELVAAESNPGRPEASVREGSALVALPK